MQRNRSAHDGGMFLPQRGAALDIGEEESQHALGQGARLTDLSCGWEAG